MPDSFVRRENRGERLGVEVAARNQADATAAGAPGKGGGNRGGVPRHQQEYVFFGMTLRPPLPIVCPSEHRFPVLTATARETRASLGVVEFRPSVGADAGGGEVPRGRRAPPERPQCTCAPRSVPNGQSPCSWRPCCSWPPASP